MWRDGVRILNNVDRERDLKRKQRVPMKQFIVGAPLERIAVNVLGPFPVSEKGNKYLLIIGDYFAKWVEAYPLENQRADLVAEVLVKEFISRFGVWNTIKKTGMIMCPC